MDTNKIDLVALDENRHVVNLILMDNQTWEEPRKHIDILHDKLLSYVAFIENGTLIKRYPSSEGLEVVIRVIFEYSPYKDGQEFINKMHDVLRDVGYAIEFVDYASL